MKRNLLTIIALISVVFLAAVLWRVDDFVYGDRMSWAEAQARTQVVSVNQAILTELKSLERLVVSVSGENFRKEKINWNSLQPYYAVASINISSGGDVQAQNILARDGSVAANWNADFVNKAIMRLDLSQRSKIWVKPFQDGNKGRHVAVLFVNQNHAYAIIGAGEVFQSLIDAQKGSLNAISVVNKAGYTVGHSIPEYVGTLLNDDTVYKAASASGVSQGLGVFTSSDQQKVFGLYNQVPGTNLITLSAAPMSSLMKGRTTLLWQFVFMGLGLVLVGLAGILGVLKPHEKNISLLKEHAQNILTGKSDYKAETLTGEAQEVQELLSSLNIKMANSVQAPVKQVVLPAAEPVIQGAERGEKELAAARMDAYQKVASALGYEMQAPLTSILGYSQMILAKSNDAEISTSVDSILRETRHAKGVLDKLFSFAGEKEFEKQEMRLDSVVVSVLKSLESLLEQKGVKVERDISTHMSLPASMDQLKQALANILTNSVEAMERRSNKELKIRMFDESDSVRLQITDTGEGIESQNLAKIFDPFFTTRSFQNHTGMGLAVATGILKEHNASIQVKSERGVGTTVEIIFKQPKMKSVSIQGPLLKAKQNIPTTISEEVVMSDVLPEPLVVPASVVMREHEEEVQKTQELMKSENISPIDVNIDSLLELPPVSEASLSIETVNEPEIQLSEKIDADVVQAMITPPKISTPIKKSKLDSFAVNIPRPGKGL